MKSKALKILAICLAFVLVFSAVLGVSAAKYVANVVANEKDYVSFIQPGDLNADKAINTADVNALKGLILQDKADTYSDVNGDDETDICDLVLQDAQPKTFVAANTIKLSGKSVYDADLASVLNTGAKYKITFATSGDVTVKINGIKDINGAAITTDATDYVFKTPLKISNSADIELQIIGEGEISNFKLVRVDMDNDKAVG